MLIINKFTHNNNDHVPELTKSKSHMVISSDPILHNGRLLLISFM